MFENAGAMATACVSQVAVLQARQRFLLQAISSAMMV